MNRDGSFVFVVIAVLHQESTCEKLLSCVAVTSSKQQFWRTNTIKTVVLLRMSTTVPVTFFLRHNEASRRTELLMKRTKKVLVLPRARRLCHGSNLKKFDCVTDTLSSSKWTQSTEFRSYNSYLQFLKFDKKN